MIRDDRTEHDKAILARGGARLGGERWSGVVAAHYDVDDCAVTLSLDRGRWRVTNYSRGGSGYTTEHVTRAEAWDAYQRENGED